MSEAEGHLKGLDPVPNLGLPREPEHGPHAVFTRHVPVLGPPTTEFASVRDALPKRHPIRNAVGRVTLVGAAAAAAAWTVAERVLHIDSDVVTWSVVGTTALSVVAGVETLRSYFRTDPLPPGIHREG